jgi:hypothetical protein
MVLSLELKGPVQIEPVCIEVNKQQFLRGVVLSFRAQLISRIILNAVIGPLAFLTLASVQAATLTLEFDTSFGNPNDTDTAPPDGATPWLTAVFDDGNTPGSVTLTMTVSGTIGIAEISQIYLNLDPVYDPADLTITRNAGSSTGPVENSIGQSANAYKPDSDGLMDILIDLPPPGGDRFGAGEVLVYDISEGTNSLTASSFNFLSTPDPNEANPTGPWLAAAKVSSTGSLTVTCNSVNGPIGECSDWIAPGIIPVPAAVWLFGSALGLLGWMRRQVS